jgi:hypothetical protein
MPVILWPFPTVYLESLFFVILQGTQAIERVFKACYKDSAPFKGGYDTSTVE